jgi:hypothetical protein
MVRLNVNKSTRWSTMSQIVIVSSEKFFFFWGKFVATHPWKIILATLAITGLREGWN